VARHPAPAPQELAAAIRAAVGRLLERLPGGILQVNDGHCGDVAEAAVRAVGIRESARYRIVDTVDFCIFGDPETCRFDARTLRRRWPRSRPPAPLTWRGLNALGLQDCGHVWLVLDGRHHDADVPDGVDSIFDLPLFRRNLASLVLARRAPLASRLAGDPWWAESFALHADLQAWADTHDLEPAGTKSMR